MGEMTTERSIRSQCDSAASVTARAIRPPAGAVDQIECFRAEAQSAPDTHADPSLDATDAQERRDEHQPGPGTDRRDTSPDRLQRAPRDIVLVAANAPAQCKPPLPIKL